MKTSTAPLPPLRSVKVLDQLRERIRYLHYSLRTEQAYVHWVRAFIRFHGVRHPATLGSSEVEAFLSWLANERKVSASTHRQALAALLFFYGKVLCVDLPWLQEIGRPRPSRRLPVVLTPDEVVRILGFLEGELATQPVAPSGHFSCQTLDCTYAPAFSLGSESAFGLAAPVFASGGSPWTAEMQQWMTYYYLDPQPQHAVAYLKPLNEALQASKGRSLADEANRGGLRSFYAKVFAQSDAAVRELEEVLATQPEDIRAFALEALRRCGTPECLRVAGATAAAPDAGANTEQLDDVWASFMATGDERYVEAVASVLPLLKVRGDPARLVVGGAAQWSLASNAYQHSRVLDICRRIAATAEPETAAILREIVTSAEAERLSRPPPEPR